MSAKLSLKLLKTIVTSAEKGLTFEGVVETLDEQKVAYNENMLKGMLEEAIKKGLFVEVDNSYVAKPKQSTGGAPPTRMFWMDKPLKPAEAKIVEKPYDKERVESDPLVSTTKLGAIKAAKAHFYNTVYWPALQEFRKLEEANSPSAQADAEPKAA
jgi:hypothetical protein